MRFPFAATLFCAVLGLAPAALAQGADQVVLTPTVGEPIPYRISLPKGWQVEKQDDLLMVSTDERMIVVGVMDLMKGEENPLPVSPAEARRIMTNMILGSDSLLFGLLREGTTAMQQDAELHDVVQEIRTLGGQKSAFMRGRMVGEESGWFEMNITLKDGIMYMVVFAAQGDDFAQHEPLFTRIRDSLVFAPAPQ